jgi:hypothetical protein
MSTRIRLPRSTDLYAAPALGALTMLDVAAAIAANALRAQHVAIEGDFHPGETELDTVARVLATECEMLRDTLRRYRGRILEQLAAARTAWPF